MDSRPRCMATNESPRFACPKCIEPLDRYPTDVRFRRCGIAYPVIDEIADLGVDAGYSVA